MFKIVSVRPIAVTWAILYLTLNKLENRNYNLGLGLCQTLLLAIVLFKYIEVYHEKLMGIGKVEIINNTLCH